MIPVGVLAQFVTALDTAHYIQGSSAVTSDLVPKLTTYTFTDVNLGDTAGRDVIILTGFMNSTNTNFTGVHVDGVPSVAQALVRSWYTAGIWRISGVSGSVDIQVYTDVAVSRFSLFIYTIPSECIPLYSLSVVNVPSGLPVTTRPGGCIIANVSRATQQYCVSAIPLDESIKPDGYSYEAYSISDTLDGTTTVIAEGFQQGLAAVSYVVPPVVEAGTSVIDSFNRSDWTGGLGLADSLHLWKQVSDSMIGVSNGQAYRASGNNATAWVDFGQQDMEVSADYSNLGTWVPVIRARVNADGSGGYGVVKNSPTQVKLDGYGGSFDVVNGDRVGLRVVEGSGVTNVSLLINNEVKITWPHSAAGRPNGTHALIHLLNDATARMDNFTVEDPAMLATFPADVDVPFRFEADSLSLSNNDPVSTWPDTSGNGRDATQVNSANQPTFNASAFGGVGGVQFASGKWLRTQNFSAVDQPNAVFFVGSAPLSTYIYDGSSAANRHLAYVHWQVPEILEWGAIDLRYGGLSRSLANNNIVTVRYPGTGAGYAHSGGGARTTASGYIGVQGIGGLTLGANYQNGMTGNVLMGALIVCHTSSLSDINRVGRHLGFKYGLPWSNITS